VAEPIIRPAPRPEPDVRPQPRPRPAPRPDIRPTPQPAIRPGLGGETQAKPRALDTSLEEDAWSTYTVSQAMLAEVVKIAGFRYDPKEDSWDFDFENIPKYFKEEPVWATLDALTLGAPLAKWGVAAKRIYSGTTAPGRAYQAGEVGFREALAIQGENMVPTTRLGRTISNPISRAKFTDEYAALAEKHGEAWFEVAARADVARRELQAASNMVRVRAGNVTSKIAKLGLNEGEQVAFTRALEEGSLDLGSTQMSRLLEQDATEAYDAVWKFRDELGKQAEEVGLLSPDRAIEQSSWMPHLQKKQYAESLKKAGYDRSKADVINEANFDSFMHRKHSTEEFEELFTRDFDPAHATVRMAQAAQAVQRHKYATSLLDSAVVKRGDQIIDHLLSPGGVLENPRLAKLWDITPEKAASLREGIKATMANAGPNGKLVNEDVAKLMSEVGWVRMNDVAPGLKLPAKYADMYVDKKVADDLAGVFQMTQGPDNLMTRIYEDGMAFFRASKTAYNPSTWVRNGVGAVIFHSFAVGGKGMMDPQGIGRGIRMFGEGLDNPLFRKAAQAGVTGGTYDNELRAAWREAFNTEGRVTALDFLGNGRIRDKIKKLGGDAEAGYKWIDEVTRLDAWARNYEKFRKVNAGKLAEDVLDERAIEFATLEVARYIPSFQMHSPFTNAIKKHIPFASFSHEAIRVWKNVMVNKPHIGFFWQHFADTAGEAFGAMAGYTPEEVDEAKANLSPYQKGKKMMMWPFQVDGKPMFLDMSYWIPMANIVEASREETDFFGQAAGLAGLNPTSNPFWNIITAATTGQDPFRRLPVEPKITERQFGIPIEGERARFSVGLAEHVAATFVPPWVPPGYAGINMMEWARGQKHHLTGDDLEQGFWRTVGSNLMGAKLHEADFNAAMLDVGRTERRLNERSSEWRLRWKFAKANDDTEAMAMAEENLRSIQIQRGKDPRDADTYVDRFIENNIPGEFRTMPRAQLQQALDRSGKLSLDSPKDRKMMNAAAAALRRKGRSRRSRPSRSRKR
jgi:hypothetical protein